MRQMLHVLWRGVNDDTRMVCLRRLGERRVTTNSPQFMRFRGVALAIRRAWPGNTRTYLASRPGTVAGVDLLDYRSIGGLFFLAR
jgi:hypothetical protein